MTNGRRSFAIDYLPESLERYGLEYSIVAIDVFRATTTVVTATSLGRKCIPAPAIEEAVALASRLPDALLAGELGGTVPYGFQLDNSSVLLVGRDDVERPLILISTSGTRVLSGVLPGQTTYATCLRNVTAQAEHLVRHESRRRAHRRRRARRVPSRRRSVLRSVSGASCSKRASSPRTARPKT